jgi:hypothetical protein
MSSYYTSGAVASRPGREFRDYVQLSGYGVTTAEIGTPGFPAETLSTWRGRESAMTTYQAQVIQWIKSPFFIGAQFNTVWKSNLALAAKALVNLRTVIGSISATRTYSRTIESGMRIWYKQWRKAIREAQIAVWMQSGGPANPPAPRPLPELPMLPVWTASAGSPTPEPTPVQQASDATDTPSPEEKVAAAEDAPAAAAAGDGAAAAAQADAAKSGGPDLKTVALVGGGLALAGGLLFVLMKLAK